MSTLVLQLVLEAPELAQNASILTQDLDTQKRAVEPDRRSPGGKGFTGLQAVLQYAFNQPLAINAYSQFGHLLTVDAFINQDCSPYATPQRIANNLATNPQGTRNCYAFLGPNQQGINEPDPSNPGACVPDPGGAPPGEPGFKTSACQLKPKPTGSLPVNPLGGLPLPVAADKGSRSSGGNTAVQTSSGTATPSSSSGGSSSLDLQRRLGQIFTSLAGASASQASAGSAASSSSSGSASGSASGSTAGQAQQLLNYLLAP